MKRQRHWLRALTVPALAIMVLVSRIGGSFYYHSGSTDVFTEGNLARFEHLPPTNCIPFSCTILSPYFALDLMDHSPWTCAGSLQSSRFPSHMQLFLCSFPISLCPIPAPPPPPPPPTAPHPTLCPHYRTEFMVHYNSSNNGHAESKAAAVSITNHPILHGHDCDVPTRPSHLLPLVTRLSRRLERYLIAVPDI